MQHRGLGYWIIGVYCYGFRGVRGLVFFEYEIEAVTMDMEAMPTNTRAMDRKG